MKVICINNNFDDLNSFFKTIFTIGKTYNVIIQNSNSTSFLIMDDSKSYVWCYKGNFLPIEEWREKKLEILLNKNTDGK